MIGAKQGGSIFHCRQPRASTAFCCYRAPFTVAQAVQRRDLGFKLGRYRENAG